MSPGNFRAAMDTYRGVGVGSMVESATPHQLIRMLFDGARAAVAAARGHLQRREVGPKCEAISKAIDIIDGGLKVSLDLSVGGQLAQNLYDLYIYMTQRLLIANLKNDVAALDEVADLLQQLGSAWESIAAKQAGTKPAATASALAPRASPPALAPGPSHDKATAPAPTGPVAAVSAGQANGFAAAGTAQQNGTAASNPTLQKSRIAAAYGVR